jgi:hypothetical protein
MAPTIAQYSITNLKKRSNLDSLYFLFFWYEFPYLFFRWTAKEMQLLVRDMDDLTACLLLHSTPFFLHLHLLLENFDLHEHLKNPWPPDKDCWDAASRTPIDVSQLSSSCKIKSCLQKFSSNRCKCKKNGVLCNSRCHSSGSCDNKWILIYDFKYFHRTLIFNMLFYLAF